MNGGIKFFNRYTGQVEQEKVLGEGALRWVYGTHLGQLSLHLLIKRAFFSRVLGWMKNSAESRREIAPFVKNYGIDVTEAEKGMDEFTCFNDFFARKLKSDARPLCTGDQVALPADARHSAWQDASQMKGGFLKGQCFDLPALLGSYELAQRYAQGAVVLSRLCPVDYHRFHFPWGGEVGMSSTIPGPLASVSPYCLSSQLSWLWTNKRELTVLHTEELGDVLLLAVGATGVGSIFQTYQPHSRVEKGDEQGYFAFGGSTVMCFFLPGRIRLAQDLCEHTAQGLETFARQGDYLGDLC